jgi:hypothetical protein
MSTPANGGKDVIYIDVDDEITGIIDKIRGSGQKIVALVLPKRATVLQSIVNMKLLKRTADESKKNIVLITSEAGLLPLAGNVGIHVAKSLQSRPEVPDAPAHDRKEVAALEDDFGDEAAVIEDSPVDKTMSVGELATGKVMAPPKTDDLDEDHIELDDDDGDAEAEGTGLVAAGSAAKAKAKKDKKDKKRLSIPNFSKFRLWLILGGVLAVLLIVFGVFATMVLPKASVAIKTDSQAIESDTTLTLKSADGTTLDVDKGVVPAHLQQVQKTLTQQVAATGQQNNGEKASGSVTLSLKDCSQDQVSVPAGVGVTANGYTFITQNAVTMQSVKVGNQCKNSSFPNFSTANVDVVALKAGAAYNLAATAYTVNGFSNVSGAGSAMAGGTDVVIKIVTQSDIDSAKQKIATTDSEAVRGTLRNDLTNGGYLPLESTFNAAAPDTKTSVEAGAQAENVTVTQTLNYTMMGVKQTDLEKVLANAVADKIDTKKQKILDYGIKEANYNIQDPKPDATILAMHATVIAGPELNTDDIKKQVAGKKASQAKDAIKQYPGVTDVTVEYSPFWVSSIPKKTSKITVTIEKPQITKNAKSDNE